MAPRFVVIDDDEGDRKLLRRLIGQLPGGGEIWMAQNGEAALALDLEDPDMVFLDHLLPGANGVELIGALTERWPRAGICLMTGQGDEEIAKESIRRGAVDYLPKRNLSPAALARVVETGCKLARMRWQIEEHREELSLFSEVLVHDLKAPIRSVRFLVEKLQEDIAEGMSAEVARDVQLIGKAADRLHDLVESLARHVDFDHEAPVTEAGARSLLEDATTMLLAEIESSGAEITLETEPVALSCHAAQVAQLFQNLIGNAIKYAGTGPPRITLRARAEGGDVHFEVEDRGIGVPPQYRKTIFEPFKRLPVAAAIPGTGLGLATCRKIVDRHKGRIWCDPEVTDGTRIHVVLPQNTAALARSA